MKKLLSFIPLGIGISAAIIYVFNVVSFRVINNGATNLQILSNLKIYLFISIAGFVVYFIIKILEALSVRKKGVSKSNSKTEVMDDAYEPFEKINNQSVSNAPTNNATSNVNYNANQNVYVPNYDYVPMYHEEKKGDYLASETKKEDVIINQGIKNNANTRSINNENIYTNENVKEEVITSDNTSYENIKQAQNNDSLPSNSYKYCYNCGEKINYNDKYCSKCGALLKVNRKNTNPYLKNVINVLEIVILILIIYFSLNMLFEYKESKDPNFTSPFKVSMTK